MAIIPVVERSAFTTGQVAHMSIIGHIDLDAFFASVEEREKPYLKGLPVVVGADPKGGKGRGVVATANYKAREYGIHSAVPITQAWRLSEWARKRGRSAVAFIVPRHRKYGTASREVFKIVRRYAKKIEMMSVDEAYLDLTKFRTYEKAREVMRKLQKDIVRETKLTASVGIGPNRMIAKIASGHRKPRGLTVVRPERVEEFIAPLPVRELPGVGKKTEPQLLRRKIKTIQDLKKYSWEELEAMFGSFGFSLYEKARGIARDTLSRPERSKSIGEHETFDVDTRKLSYLMDVLSGMSSRIVARLKKERFHGFRTVVLTVRFHDFVTAQRSTTSKEVLKTARSLETKALSLLMPFLDERENPKQKFIRLLGLRIEKLR